jgi:ribosomal-protein-serine acetyltransferase
MERGAAIATDRLIALDGETELRAVRIADANELFALIERNRERLAEWLPWAVPGYSIADTHAFLRGQVAEMLEGASLTMTIRHHDAMCGAIGLHKIDWRNKSSSIGYWIDEANQGEGIMTSACRAILSEAFGNLGLHRVEIRCAIWNHRSSAIPKRLGFVEEGILKEAEWVHDRWLDLRVFSMLAQDWKTRAA